MIHEGSLQIDIVTFRNYVKYELSFIRKSTMNHSQGIPLKIKKKELNSLTI